MDLPAPAGPSIAITIGGDGVAVAVVIESAPMESWNLNEIDVEPHQPQVLDSESEGRAIVINLPAGEQLQEHQVHERAWLLVIDGEIEVSDAERRVGQRAAPGLLSIFDPNERHEVTAQERRPAAAGPLALAGRGSPQQQGLTSGADCAPGAPGPARRRRGDRRNPQPGDRRSHRHLRDPP